MAGEKNLTTLIAHMEPVLHVGEYIFASVEDPAFIPREMTICEIKEKEGVTVVMAKEHADALGLTYTYIAAWITLNVHSSLEAVGLTAAFSAALAQQQISCNVMAGYYHDHIFVDQKDKEKALLTLENLVKNAKNDV
jgi:uncharacterized protein